MNKLANTNVTLLDDDILSLPYINAIGVDGRIYRCARRWSSDGIAINLNVIGVFDRNSRAWTVLEGQIGDDNVVRAVDVKERGSKTSYKV